MAHAAPQPSAASSRSDRPLAGWFRVEAVNSDAARREEALEASPARDGAQRARRAAREEEARPSRPTRTSLAVGNRALNHITLRTFCSYLLWEYWWCTNPRTAL
ncbi:uncharacterized protein LOC143839553 isoform X2 [Paroedura picta]|uniref:uncharacterized protein LOC143839553 isoform X2 n=1 Tax=Paroedura picta TaxID=143630 RepID=UPI004056D8D8